MFHFQQYIAFLIGLIVLLMGFWLMLFLVNLAIYWAFGGTMELIKEKKARQKAEQQ